MPRSRARQFGGGGGGGGLAGIIASMYGMPVDIDPAFLEQQDILEAGDIENLPTKAAQPFKAGNILAKGRAADMNAEYAADELASKGALGRAKELTSFNTKDKEQSFIRMIPHELEKAEKLGVISNKTRVNLEEALAKITKQSKDEDFEREEKGKNRGVVREMGGIGTDENVAAVDKLITPRAITAKGNQLRAANAGSNAETAKSTLNELLTKQEAGPTLRNAALKSDLDTRELEAQTELFGQDFQNRQFQLENVIPSIRAKEFRDDIVPMAQGQTLFDVRRNQPVYQNLDPMMQQFMQQSGQTSAQPSYSQDRVTIGGKSYKKSSTAPANPIQAKPAEQSTAVVQQPQPAPAEVEQSNPISRSIGAMGTTLGNAGTTVSNALTKTLPRDLLLRLLSPYYQPAPTKR